MFEQVKKLFGRKESKAKRSIRTFPVELGRQGRDSLIDPRSSDTEFFSIVVPDDKKTFSARRLTIERLLQLPLDEAIAYLVETSPLLSAATEAYIEHTISDFSLESEEGNDADIRIIEEFMNKMGGKSVFLSVLKDFVYGMYVENGFCGELIFSEDGFEPTKLTYVSPYTLAYVKTSHPDIGQYYLVGQWISQEEARRLTQNGNGDNIIMVQGSPFKILYDEVNPEEYDTFFYLPTNKKGSKPYGTSQMSSGIFSAIALQNMIQTTVDFVRSQAYPKGLFSIDIEPLIAAEYSSEEIDEAVEQAVGLLRGELSAADVTQNIVSAMKVLYTLVGSVQGTGINSVEYLGRLLETQNIQSTKIPRALSGIKSQGQSLNSDEARYDWLYFNKRLRALRAIVKEEVTKAFTIILRHAGSLGTVFPAIDESDPELNRIEAEYLKMFGEALAAVAEVNDIPLLTQKELRLKLKEETTLFADIESEVPSEIKIDYDQLRQQRMNPNPEEEPTDNNEPDE